MTLGVWMMFAGTALAAPGHCNAQNNNNATETAAIHLSEHCQEMMGEAANTADDPAPSGHSMPETCCCPAVMAALPIDVLPPLGRPYLRASWASPMGESALSPLFLLEAPPPRA